MNVMKEFGSRFGSEGLAAAVGAEATVGLANAGVNTALPKMPEKKFRVGGISATVWKGVSDKGTVYYNVQLGRSYKDKDNIWKTTSSLKENDVPKAMVLLQKAYEYVIAQQSSAVLS
ncbi:hypothetical protein HYU17_00550 [Candidatus Woesearchaeota archaeon]|nr:hypothetical protein [Candidatus Woesearchaeota archaeon]